MEYKIKWRIELEADSPVQAAKLALEMLQSPDSTAKVFEVKAEGSKDYKMIDLEEIEIEDTNRMLANGVIGKAAIQFGRMKMLRFQNDELDVHLFRDETIFNMEVVEDFEIGRGTFGKWFFVLDDRDKMSK
jgi:hypothetical protein